MSNTSQTDTGTTTTTTTTTTTCLTHQKQTSVLLQQLLQLLLPLQHVKHITNKLNSPYQHSQSASVIKCLPVPAK